MKDKRKEKFGKNRAFISSKFGKRGDKSTNGKQKRELFYKKIYVVCESLEGSP